MHNGGDLDDSTDKLLSDKTRVSHNFYVLSLICLFGIAGSCGF
jgi:hypothetical protein